ncbi:PD-(D/E)XK motif protein [Lysobacter korlensis]|uniref:PD-(D/E)XK motif protein n=1 Tax=Lysobacter korlensis TaxID=553636 RepID=A0ABV6RS51_9GAMM
MDATLPEWHLLRGNYIDTATPMDHIVVASPELRIFHDPDRSALGVRLRLDRPRTWSRAAAMRHISTRVLVASGVHYAELYTTLPELHRAVYALVQDVVARLHEGERDCLRAMELSLADFEALVARSVQLSRERVVGLHGELMVLELLLDAGHDAIAAWVGPRRQPHDFRLNGFELEVKTTLANERRHTIHGLNQLTPSPGNTLDLVSVRIAPPGASGGASLDDRVAALRRRLAHDPATLSAFEASLQASGHEAGHPECAVPYAAAAPVQAIRIGTDFPCISHAWLAEALGVPATGRVAGVNLTLQLEGLGRPFEALDYGAADDQ